jgi:lipopolysaccharide biosynthesis glycosyltransferase
MNDTKVVDVVINIGPDYLRQGAVFARDLAKFSRIARLHILLVDCEDDFEIKLRNEIAEVPFDIEFYSITNRITALPNIESMRGVPIVSFGRLIISEVLPLEVIRVLYVDTDIKIRKNLDELLNTDFHHVIGAVKQKNVGLLNNQGLEIFDYFNAGVLLINLEKWRSEELGQAVRELLMSRGPFEYMDQDVLNIIFENLWFELNHDFNYFSEESLRPLSNNRDPSIVHFAGSFKPWKYPVASDFHREWRMAEIEYFGRSDSRWIESFIGYRIFKIFKIILPRKFILLLRSFLGKKMDSLLHR